MELKCAYCHTEIDDDEMVYKDDDNFICEGCIGGYAEESFGNLHLFEQLELLHIEDKRSLSSIKKAEIAFEKSEIRREQCEVV